MKIVPGRVYPRGTRDIFVASLCNHSVSCGSVVLCVEKSRLKLPTTKNELLESQWATDHNRFSKKDLPWISWRDKIEGTARRKEKRKPVQTKWRMISFFPILVGLQHKPLSVADTVGSLPKLKVHKVKVHNYQHNWWLQRWSNKPELTQVRNQK